MKGNPARPGGLSTSKPTWWDTAGCPTTSAFFRLRWRAAVQATGTKPMDQSGSTVARQLAQAASAFEQRRTGHAPRSVTVVLSEDTLVITLHGALSPAERALAKSPAGAAQVQEFHRQLFTNAAGSLRQEIKRITGVGVREATAEVEAGTGAVVQVFTTGTVVQVFLLAHSVPADTFSGSGAGDRP